MEWYKNRRVPTGTKVLVYRNLHTGTWSVKALDGEYKGLVVAHPQTVALRHPKPWVSLKGHARVLRERKKYVHAGVVGYLELYHSGRVPQEAREASYNPFLAPRFFFIGQDNDWWTGQAEKAVLSSGLVYVTEKQS